MEKDIARVLLSQEQIQTRVEEMGRQIAWDYRGKNPAMVCILKGAVMFYTDLLRALPIPLTMDFMAVSSYNGTTSTGAVKINKDLSEDIAGRHIIIVEDILDSGNTLSYLTKIMSARGPASIRIVTLLDKPERRTADVEADYVGFTIPDAFVVGYGLDYDQKYRNLPYIGVLKPEVYS